MDKDKLVETARELTDDEWEEWMREQELRSLEESRAAALRSHAPK